MKAEKVLGDIIKNIRISCSLSQEELSNRTGLDRTYISLLETGKRNPTLVTIIKICKALDILPSELMLKLEENNIFDVDDGDFN